MVRTMCKEKIKSGINPIISTLLWLISVYVIYILWGIFEILFEFNFGFLKFIICLLITIYYGWFLISKILTELEVEITKDELIIKSILSKRSKLLLCQKLCDIQKIYENKKPMGLKIIKSFKRPMQKGKMTYVVFKEKEKLWCIEIKTGKNFILKPEHLFEKGNQEK